jgi:DNA-binding NarL/FixJ family response regulator
MIKPAEVIRVMIADDHRALIGSLRALLERHGCEVVGEATTGEEALALAAQVRPQVIVMDLEMPGTGGLAAAHRMKKVAPAAKVLILSAYDDESDVLEALNEAGVAGYLVKTDAPDELITAVRTVAGGKRYLSPPSPQFC